MVRACVAVIGSFLLVACSVPPVVVPGAAESRFRGAVFEGELLEIAPATPGEELFRVFEQGATGFVPLSAVMEAVQESAQKFCERRGRSAHELKLRRSVPPHILGNFPRAELVFECHLQKPKLKEAGSALGMDKLTQLERLKNLLDSGALTQQEFDTEKAKVLN